MDEERHKRRKLEIQEEKKGGRERESQKIHKRTKSLSSQQQMLAHSDFYLPVFWGQAEVTCFDVYKEV